MKSNPIMKKITLVLLGAATVVLAAACGNRAEDVCEDLCAKTEECAPGASCTCNPDSQAECGNEDEILDHLEGCAGKACDQFGACLLETPACSS